MKRIITAAILLTFGVCLFTNAQEIEQKKLSTSERFKKEYVYDKTQDSIRVGAYLSDPDSGPSNIRLIPGGEIIKTIPDGVDVIFFLIEAWNGWIRIYPEMYVDNEKVKIHAKSCWIHGSILGASTSNYGGQDINIYSKPDRKSKTVYVIKGEQGYVTFIDVKDGWAKVKIKNSKGKIIIGWIESGWLCGNPYTNCS